MFGGLCSGRLGRVPPGADEPSSQGRHVPIAHSELAGYLGPLEEPSQEWDPRSSVDFTDLGERWRANTRRRSEQEADEEDSCRWRQTRQEEDSRQCRRTRTWRTGLRSHQSRALRSRGPQLNAYSLGGQKAEGRAATGGARDGCVACMAPRCRRNSQDDSVDPCS